MPPKKKHKRLATILEVGVALIVIAFIFGKLIPEFASYEDAFAEISKLTPAWAVALVLATIANIVTYWGVNMSALPGLHLWPAAVVTQTPTTISSVIPMGGAFAMGILFAMLRSWGWGNDSVVLYIGVTGIWNEYAKLGLPILALALEALAGGATHRVLVAATIGIVILAVAIWVLVEIFRSRTLAGRLGRLGNRVGTRALGLVHRGPVTGLDERLVEFRRTTIGLIRRRWIPLTLTAVSSQLALFCVFLFSLRGIGVGSDVISTPQVMLVFSISRVLTMIPITPGGLGIGDAAFIAGLSAFGVPHASAVGADLLYRLLTYVLQVPLGGITYVVWRVNKSWRRPPGSRSVLETAEAR